MKKFTSVQPHEMKNIYQLLQNINAVEAPIIQRVVEVNWGFTVQFYIESLSVVYQLRVN